MKKMILSVLVLAMASTAFGYDGSIPKPSRTPSRETASTDDATPTPAPTKKGHGKSKTPKPQATPTPSHS